MMTIEKSLQRIEWRFSIGKSFAPNHNDVEAYNKILEYVTEKQKKQLIDNQLFGKMYIYLLSYMMVKYDACFYDKIPQQELHRILDKSAKELLEKALDHHNQIELFNHLEKDLTGEYDPMGYEEASENIRAMVNGAINEYSPKHLERV